MDRFDPRAASEAGCDLRRLLWVRGPAVSLPATREMLAPYVAIEYADPAALAEEADVCLVAGTSAVVQPAASLPLMARRAGGRGPRPSPPSSGSTATSVPSSP